MRTYSDELKASLVERMLLLENASVPRLSRETGILHGTPCTAGDARRGASAGWPPPRWQTRPNVGAARRNLRWWWRQPHGTRPSSVSIAASVAYIPRRSRPGAWSANGPTTAGRCSALLGTLRRQRTSGGFGSWRGSYGVRKRPWRRRRRCWCCEKKPRRSGGKARPYDQCPRSPPGDRADPRGLPGRGATETGVRGVGD